MDNQDMLYKENSAEVDRVLGDEELNMVIGGVGTTNNMVCPRCKRETPHTPTEDGRYVCNSCKYIHKRV